MYMPTPTYRLFQYRTEESANKLVVRRQNLARTAFFLGAIQGGADSGEILSPNTPAISFRFLLQVANGISPIAWPRTRVRKPATTANASFSVPAPADSVNRSVT